MKLFRKVFRNERGFTLIELMVVVVIIGILAAIAAPKFFNQADKARINRAKADIQQIKTAIELWAADEDGGNGRYPTTRQIGTALTAAGIDIDIKDPWGQDYIYMVNNNGNPKNYYIVSTGQDKLYGGSDDIVASDTASPKDGENASVPSGWSYTAI